MSYWQEPTCSNVACRLVFAEHHSPATQATFHPKEEMTEPCPSPLSYTHTVISSLRCCVNLSEGGNGITEGKWGKISITGSPFQTKRATQSQVCLTLNKNQKSLLLILVSMRVGEMASNSSSYIRSTSHSYQYSAVTRLPLDQPLPWRHFLLISSHGSLDNTISCFCIFTFLVIPYRPLRDQLQLSPSSCSRSAGFPVD